MGEKKTDTISEEKASAERTSAGDQVCPEANDAQDLCERILDGWLKMSTAISNERIVSAMTYNESMVCGALYQVQSGGASLLTATRLCSRLQILKPQMNVILNGLEKRGLIRRERSSKDHRQVHILLTKEGRKRVCKCASGAACTAAGIDRPAWGGKNESVCRSDAHCGGEFSGDAGSVRK